MNKQKMMGAVMVAIITGSTVLATGSAFAQTPASTPMHKDFFAGFADFFAQKFGLDKSKVQSAVDEFRTQKRTEMQKTMVDRQKTRLDQLVKDGTITQDIENAIIAEQKVLHDKYSPEKLKDLSSDQRKAQIDAMKKEAEDWAKAHNIDVKYLIIGFGMHVMHGRMGSHFKDWDDSPAPTQ